ncbi:MAG: hypothetical protein ACXAC2_08465 [Candidatus Kariarchaeaceae archaeon]
MIENSLFRRFFYLSRDDKKVFLREPIDKKYFLETVVREKLPLLLVAFLIVIPIGELIYMANPPNKYGQRRSAEVLFLYRLGYYFVFVLIIVLISTVNTYFQRKWQGFLIRKSPEFRKMVKTKVPGEYDFHSYVDSYSKQYLMRETARKIVDEGVEADYKCFSCKQIIPLVGDICPYCDEPAPICIICFNDPEPLENISLLECCQSYAHTEHLNNWLTSSDKCPYCKTKEPEIVDMEDIT